MLNYDKCAYMQESFYSKVTRGVQARPLLLLLDGNSFQPDNIRRAAEKSIILFCIQPISHNLWIKVERRMPLFHV